MPKFKTTIMLAEDMNATGINVPEAVVEQLGAGRKPKVSVTLKGYTYRSTVFFMGGKFMLPLAQEHRAAAGVKGGDKVEVTLELDTAPREVEGSEVAARLAWIPVSVGSISIAPWTTSGKYIVIGWIALVDQRLGDIERGRRPCLQERVVEQRFVHAGRSFERALTSASSGGRGCSWRSARRLRRPDASRQRRG
jgi:hypothetical protein